MKSFFIQFFSLLAAAVFFCGCCGKNNYSLVLLGDTHYDAPKYHDEKVMVFKPLVPYGVGTKNKEGIFSWRNHTLWVTESRAGTNHNIPLNAKMWEKHLPEILDNAAACARKNNSLYAVQLGDMIHGDCGRLDLHQANLLDSIHQMTKRFDCPVLLTCGNHDPRGPFGQEAWDTTAAPYLKSIVKDYPQKRGNYAIRIGRDLFYFHDLMNPDLDYMEQVFKANPDTRYTFFLSHAPLLPMEHGSLKEILTDDYHRLFALLEKRDAIILSGHTHWISLTQYQNKKNGRKMSQFVINSTVRYPKKQLAFNPKETRVAPPLKKTKGNIKFQELWDRYFKGRINTPLNTNGTGYGLLRVSDEGVFVDYRNLSQDQYHTFKLR